jgi:predicted secreted protein
MKRTILFLLLVIPAAFVFAGDLAVLENLGFSADGRYFMFGQHVLVTDAGQAYAETAVVDVARNDFVPSGWKKSAWSVPMRPNQNSRGALYEILGESSDLKQRYGISHLNQGRLLYTRSNGDDVMVEIEGSDETVPTLSFRDFELGREYELAIFQETQTDGEDAAAAFHIEMTVIDSSGSESSYKVGRPDYMRPGVSDYRIARIWIGPEGKSLVIAVAKQSPDLSIRYMVETLVLN